MGEVNTLRTSSEVTSLAHKSSDDTVERRSLVSETFLSGAESTEILSGLGYDVRSQGHLDSSYFGAVRGDIEVAHGILTTCE